MKKEQQLICYVSLSNLLNTLYIILPNITLDPPIVEIKLESNKLSCLAKGNPAPTTKWKLPDNTVLEKHGKVYFINRLTPDLSSDRYVCVASNGIKQDGVASIEIAKPSDTRTNFFHSL